MFQIVNAAARHHLVVDIVPDVERVPERDAHDPARNGGPVATRQARLQLFIFGLPAAARAIFGRTAIAGC